MLCPEDRHLRAPLPEKRRTAPAMIYQQFRLRRHKHQDARRLTARIVSFNVPASRTCSAELYRHLVEASS